MIKIFKVYNTKLKEFNVKGAINPNLSHLFDGL